MNELSLESKARLILSDIIDEAKGCELTVTRPLIVTLSHAGRLCWISVDEENLEKFGNKYIIGLVGSLAKELGLLKGEHRVI